MMSVASHYHGHEVSVSEARFCINISMLRKDYVTVYLASKSITVVLAIPYIARRVPTWYNLTNVSSLSLYYKMTLQWVLVETCIRVELSPEGQEWNEGPYVGSQVALYSSFSVVLRERERVRVREVTGSVNPSNWFMISEYRGYSSCVLSLYHVR
jgi:hypothetical protein